jgi:hypothetical protein
MGGGARPVSGHDRIPPRVTAKSKTSRGNTAFTPATQARGAIDSYAKSETSHRDQRSQ